MRAVETLQEFARKQGLPEQSIFGLALALEECGSNIVNHALKRDSRQKFQVSLQHTSDSFVIELRDRGPAFDPTADSESRKTRQANDDDLPGGWGIQLVCRYMDEIRYRREDEQNVLCLIKRLTRTADPEARSDVNG